jgi:tetratricopeptide (TPR) repeat protein
MDKANSSQNEVGQALRGFTVLILREKEVMGTGFAVSMDGKIVTCAHVVRDVLDKHPREADSAEVTVYFPQITEIPKRKRQAKVLASFPNHEDDVVILQLVDKTMPLPPENLAILGRGDDSYKHPFEAFGFRQGFDNEVLYASGEILGLIPRIVFEDDEALAYHGEELQLRSSQFAKGLSGAAVYDETKNLVVGVISHFKEDKPDGKAVNAHVLSFAPLALELKDSNERLAGQRPNQEAPEDEFKPTSSTLNYAPNVLEEWVGREELLSEIWKLYEGKSKRLVGMVGFGGEGKTSLARKWLESFMQRHTSIPVFWWSFYENRNSDEFLSAFLTFLGGETLGRETNSASQKASYIGSLLGKHEILFVLDGFEVMQHEDSEAYGTVRNRDLLDMLKFAALNDRRSFGMLTTRAPLLDLQPYNTYQHVDISRLSEADGRDLLRKAGVNGEDAELNKLINDWDGHALTLSLLGKYLAEKFGGDISHVKDIPKPEPNEPFYERVTRVLKRYDSHLSDADRAFMQIFSAFRLPVSPDAFGKVFLTNTGSKLNAHLVDLSFWGLKTLVDGLIQRGFLRESREGSEIAYSTHPLIRNHYAQSLQGDKETHRAIAEHYQANTPEQVRGRVPTLQELQPYIEIVHHLCQAGAYDEAWEVHLTNIQRSNESLIINKLGAYETELNIMLDFLPNGDSSQDALVSRAKIKSLIISNVGLCLQNLGRTAEVIPLYLRAKRIFESSEDWRNACVTCQLLTSLSLQLGKLAAAQEYAKQSLDFAQRMLNDNDQRKGEESGSICYLAWIRAYQNQFGSENGALALFKSAEKLKQEIGNTKYLYSGSGIWHARSLFRVGDRVYARSIIEENLEICYRNSWLDDISLCHRVQGDLDVDENQFIHAQKHYDEAIRTALTIERLFVRIEAWIARGLFYAKYMEKGQAALADLEQAMKPILDSGYRIYEADCRIALAWAYKNMPNPDLARAKQEAERARDMSIEMNYMWGKEDAEEVLAALGKEE